MNKKLLLIISISVLIIVSIIFYTANLGDDREVSRLTDKINDIIVVLDAGHGGEDGGAVSSSGVIEADINLKITLKLKDIMNLNGFHTVMTKALTVYRKEKNPICIRGLIYIIQMFTMLQSVFIRIFFPQFPVKALRFFMLHGFPPART